jgi:hypothetical protein
VSEGLEAENDAVKAETAIHERYPHGVLKFSTSAVAAQIANTSSRSTFLPNWNGAVGKPTLIFIGGNGVPSRSNWIDCTTTQIVVNKQSDSNVPACDMLDVIEAEAPAVFGGIIGDHDLHSIIGHSIAKLFIVPSATRSFTGASTLSVCVIYKACIRPR